MVLEYRLFYLWHWWQTRKNLKLSDG